MSDVTIQARGEAVPPASEVAFVGWLAYRPDEPDNYPFLNVWPEVGSYRGTRPTPADGQVVVAIRITIPLPTDGGTR
jgi:hypothetical protein